MQITFVGEQDGSIERELKRHWIEYFNTDVNVNLAALARVIYEGSSERKVALCIRADHADRRALVEKVTLNFKKLFKSTESLDVIFLSEEQERKLLAVAKPFYRQGVQYA